MYSVTKKKDYYYDRMPLENERWNYAIQLDHAKKPIEMNTTVD